MTHVPGWCCTTSVPPDAEPEPVPSIEPSSWSYFSDRFENAPSFRSSAWRQVGLWAVDRLSERLGGDWPGRTWDKHGGLPGGMELAVGHPVAYFELIELALWLEVLCGCEGFADVCRSLKQDPRAEQVLHVRLELEVGALAAANGHGVRFERPIPHSSKTSDISIDVMDGEPMVTEARVLLQDEESRAINGFADQAFQHIHDLELRHSVQCDGEITRLLTDEQFTELLDAVETHARLVAVGAAASPILLHGATLQIRRDTEQRGKGLSGPALAGDLWTRIADRLVKKAKQTEGGQNVWIRVLALNGLWLFTSWAKQSQAERLASMRHNIAVALGGHPHVGGVVISSASGWPQGQITPEECTDGLGGHAVLRCIPPMMARETLITPLSQDASTITQATVWRDLYNSEPAWLDTALTKFDLPLVAEIFATSD